MRDALLNPNRALIGDLLSVRPNWGVSTRRLTRRYTGPCMNVRRSSDNATRDIYFAGDALDVEAIRSFAGAGGSAFVVTWYDQFASAASALTQATAGTQPLILNAGVLEILGNRAQSPGVRGFGAQTLIAATPPFTASTEFTQSIVHVNRNSGTASHVILNSSTRIGTYVPYLTTFYFDFGGTGSPNRINVASTVTTGVSAAFVTRNSVVQNVKEIRVNGVQAISGLGTSATLNQVQLFANGATEYADSAMGEVLLFNASLAPDQLTLLNVNQKIFYGL